MIKPDIIVCWPKDIYYPLFVHEMNRDRDLFGKVICVMTPGVPDRDFTKDIKIKESTVLTPDMGNLTAGGKDWRDVAVNQGLQKAHSDYILFLEQDFLAQKGFYKELFIKAEGFDTVGIWDSNRFHPACLLVKRESLNKTDKDFSAYPPEGDHFYKVSKQLKDLGNWQTLEGLNIDGWHHISGFTYNYQIPEAFHRRNEFYTYNYYADFLDQPKEWKEFCRNKFKEIDLPPLDKNIASYFEEFL